ncbi:DUF805 domain-containing protein [Phenylobacterium sp. J426]|uniref:DUF805 domain-containing protein n=1 Tax=Phenylobacterium sp. J426 TaxID=2898439 RepID=UPI002150A3F6|nr:DUF805 domain-containing protein [Phenylobacterium sp. J426]MCR5872958.1 DUF805 domain-containing protein [Phenylobacterium sp. J426]
MAEKPAWTRLFSFRGRAARREYWRVLAALFVFGVVLQLASVLPGVVLIALPLGLATNVVQWAVVARRLHDLGRSGWWQVPATALGLMVVAEAVSRGLIDPENPKPLPPLLAVAMLLMLAFFIAIGSVRGDPGPNRFGEPPR